MQASYKADFEWLKVEFQEKETKMVAKINYL